MIWWHKIVSLCMTKTRTHDTSWKFCKPLRSFSLLNASCSFLAESCFIETKKCHLFCRKWLYCDHQMYKHVQSKVTFTHQQFVHEETTTPSNVQTWCYIKDHLHAPAHRSWTNNNTSTTSSSICSTNLTHQLKTTFTKQCVVSAYTHIGGSSVNHLQLYKQSHSLLQSFTTFCNN